MKALFIFEPVQPEEERADILANDRRRFAMNKYVRVKQGPHTRNIQDFA